jgi:hypothetical protein
MTPFDPPSPNQTPRGSHSLLLWIQDCSCKCGQRWVHSHLTYNNGGTPLPKDEDKLSVSAIVHSRRSASHCHRCAPLGLGVGWERAESAAPTVSVSKPSAIKTKLSALDLLKKVT